MNKKIGFIGCGNMGRAMVGALAESPMIENHQIMVSTKSEQSLSEIQNMWDVRTTLVNQEVATFADIIVIAVKPTDHKKVIMEIKDIISEEQIIVLIAAGITLEQADEWFGKEVKLVRTMPNTPVLVNAGMSAICPNSHIEEAELHDICQIFKVFGEYELLDENDFHAFIALCGSSPAYIFMLIEAMADAAVKLGLPRAKAYKMAEQSILGSAKMALNTGLHPAQLKDMVCSPGGSTIEAVAELEKKGFRSAMISAMEVCAEKSKSMQEDSK
ncbi:pyrroline-5-carboxylate reductase [Bacillus sp. AGMB 02131]|uniref:Pyrroline-5-carboxylate reductase n=1 Tax=Peribacillus faecalis TaxID=2772559 RepID=A0A927CVT0_9BACI|nr:pyrroline-5-carboxylate reductase [Peribacillus faecalis]MBD3108436.1 pyrroline-5-carboxylate reductase [Peribacillus faecalis]